jgi:LIVCS family branched-chain amino acid:cation transporter
VIKHLKENKSIQENASSHLPIFLKSALIGAGLLSTVYFALVLLGAMYAPELGAVPCQEMLGFIAQKALGVWAAPVVCVAVVMACLTTAIVLTSLFADFLRKELAQNKINPPTSLLITLAIAFFTSTLGFSKIAQILGPILEITYPALIVLTVLSISYKLWGWTTIRMPIAIALFLKLILRAI